MLAIRLTRTGKAHAPHYRIVVQEKRSKLNGSVVEIVGHYHPAQPGKLLVVDKERVAHWLKMGAQPSDTVTNLLVKEGLLDKSKMVHHFYTPKPKEEKPAKAAPVAEEAVPTEEAETAEEVEAPVETPSEETAAEAPETAVEEPASEAAEPAEETETPAEVAEPEAAPEEEVAEPAATEEAAEPKTPEEVAEPAATEEVSK